MKVFNKVITIKKEMLDYYNGLLQLIDFDDDSVEMENLINHYSAIQDDYIGVASVSFDDGKIINIDIASGSSNYYDNVVLSEIKGYCAYELYVCDCEYELGKDFEIEYNNTIYKVDWNIVE